MNGGSGSSWVEKKENGAKNGGKNKETKVRHGVAHMKKGRKGKRWLR